MGKLIALIILVGAGWILGTIYPAPNYVMDPIQDNLGVVVSKMDLSPDGVANLHKSLNTEQFAQLTAQAANLAASAGKALIIEHDDAALKEHTEALEAAESAAKAAATAPALHPDVLMVCPRMTVLNSPPTKSDGSVKAYSQYVEVNSVKILVNPTVGTCLSSGFGERNGRMHKGIDFRSADGGPVLAGGDGVILEKKYRDDYGNMILIDHGKGVYTRYAHLSSFAPGIEVGTKVKSGQQLGLMGNTAAYAIPVHLHYELLLGYYTNPKASFGLAPKDPFSYPAAK